MAWCGLRWEEVAALEVYGVRTLRRELVITQVITRARRIKPYAKTAAGNRTVPAPAHAHVLDRLVPLGRRPGTPNRSCSRPSGRRRATEHRLQFRSTRTGPRFGHPLRYAAW